VSGAPTASIIIPTRARADYLEVTLASVVPQARALGAEVIVARDGLDGRTAAVAARHGARLVSLDRPTSANAARNAGVAAAEGEVIVLIDDDVEAPPGWLEAMIAGIREAPDRDVFGGPIRARLEGGPRGCGREPPPITTLDFGGADCDVPLVWGANMAIRRTALDRVGAFDATLLGHGDEEEWERRYLAGGGRIRYIAAAGLDHRRNAADSRLSALSRAAYQQGRARRRVSVRTGTSKSILFELRTLAGCGWHVARRRCLYGVVMGARTAGAIVQALAELVGADPASKRPTGDAGADFLSGTSGEVWGIRATIRAVALDTVCDATALATGLPWRLDLAAAQAPRRRVLVLATEREDAPNLLEAARGELLRSRHDVDFAATPVGGRGKFENLNRLLAEHPAAGHDWLLLLDDDVALPSGFLDRFLFLAERFALQLAQPAHRHRSHAGWQVTRRRPASLARETRFVEIGPLVALHASTFEVLLPFPPLRYGWGLDLHWSALARERGWPIGVVDATPIRHGLRRIASSYGREDAIAETRGFLADHEYTPAAEAGRTLAVHRSWQ
jgi:GT2 family glycosyltransferase